jgi:hypothetical protein
MSHPFSYPNIAVGLKVDFTPGYDPTYCPQTIHSVVREQSWKEKNKQFVSSNTIPGSTKRVLYYFEL